MAFDSIPVPQGTVAMRIRRLQDSTSPPRHAQKLSRQSHEHFSYQNTSSQLQNTSSCKNEERTGQTLVDGRQVVQQEQGSSDDLYDHKMTCKTTESLPIQSLTVHDLGQGTHDDPRLKSHSLDGTTDLFGARFRLRPIVENCASDKTSRPGTMAIDELDTMLTEAIGDRGQTVPPALDRSSQASSEHDGDESSSVVSRSDRHLTQRSPPESSKFTKLAPGAHYTADIAQPINETANDECSNTGMHDIDTPARPPKFSRYQSNAVQAPSVVIGKPKMPPRPLRRTVIHSRLPSVGGSGNRLRPLNLPKLVSQVQEHQPPFHGSSEDRKETCPMSHLPNSSEPGSWSAQSNKAVQQDQMNEECGISHNSHNQATEAAAPSPPKRSSTQSRVAGSHRPSLVASRIDALMAASATQKDFKQANEGNDTVSRTGLARRSSPKSTFYPVSVSANRLPALQIPISEQAKLLSTDNCSPPRTPRRSRTSTSVSSQSPTVAELSSASGPSVDNGQRQTQSQELCLSLCPSASPYAIEQRFRISPDRDRSRASRSTVHLSVDIQSSPKRGEENEQLVVLKAIVQPQSMEEHVRPPTPVRSRSRH